MDKRTRIWLGAALAACSFGAAAVPAFQVQDLGAGVVVDTNSAGLVLGGDDYTLARPWVQAGASRSLLPLPGGAVSVSALRIGETGAVVGQVGSRAAVWWPADGNGWQLELLPFPPGATTGKALAVNAGNTVLVSFGTPSTLVTGMQVWTYRPWLYSRSAGWIDLAARHPGFTGWSDAVDLDDAGRVLLQGGQILEPDGRVTPTPAFPEPSPGGYRWIYLRASRLNADGAFIGVAGLSSSMDYAQVVRHVPGSGWKVLGGLHAYVGALGIDRAGDTLLFANYVCPGAYGLGYATASGGTYCLDDLVASGLWSFQSSAARGALSATTPGATDARVGSIVSTAYSLSSGSWRIARLSPAGDLPPPPATTLSATPHPGSWQQPYDAIRLSWPSAGPLAKAYTIERKQAGGSYAEIARLGATYAQYDDTSVTPLATYSYRIAAIGLAGLGPPSNEATAKAPAAMDRTPPTVTVTAPADGAAVTGLVTVSASFADNVGVTYARMSYSAGSGSGTICSSVPSSPAKTLTLSCKWDTRRLPSQPPTAVIGVYGQDAIGNWVQQDLQVNITYTTKGGGKGR